MSDFQHGTSGVFEGKIIQINKLKMSNYSNTTIECLGGVMPAYEAPGLVPILIILHLITLGTFLIHAKVLTARVSISHPVFAGIFQELAILSVCELVNILLLGYVAWTHLEPILVLSLLVGRMAMQFHAVVWLVVTLLR